MHNGATVSALQLRPAACNMLKQTLFGNRPPIQDEERSELTGAGRAGAG